MNYKEIQLHVKATFRNFRDEYQHTDDLAVQMFNLRTNQWELLFEGNAAENGKLYWRIPLINLMEVEDATVIAFLSALKADFFPCLRLINKPSIEKEWTEVLSFAMISGLNKEKQLFEVNFGDLWLLDEQSINRHLPGKQPDLEYTLIALPRPNGNSNLHPAMLAAIHQTEAFKGFSIDTSIVKLTSEEEIIAKEKQVKKLKEELSVAMNSLVVKDAVIQQKNKQYAEMAQKLEDKAIEIDNLKEEVNSLTPSDGEVSVHAKPLKEVYTKVIDEVGQATEQLKDSRFTLTNVSLNLKTHVKNTGDNFELQLIGCS